jgi:hypothetical protein
LRLIILSKSKKNAIAPLGVKNKEKRDRAFGGKNPKNYLQTAL